MKGYRTYPGECQQQGLEKEDFNKNTEKESRLLEDQEYGPPTKQKKGSWGGQSVDWVQKLFI